MLAEILQDLRLKDGTYGRCELDAPWGISFAPQAQARFHFVAAGACALRDPSGRWRALDEGDLVLLPHGKGHELASKPRGRSKPLETMPLEEIGDRTYCIRAGGHGAHTTLVCCSVTFGQAMDPILPLMPPVLLLRKAMQHDPTLSRVLDAMAEEVGASRVGSSTIMVRLADVLVTSVIRDWAESQGDDARGWLAGARDRRVGRVLAAIHREPERAWSLDALSRVASTSRSVFSERFAAVVGIPPARYVARWRMHLACEWLREGKVTVAEAAARLGYDSEAAFSRAFKRHAGRPPSAVRREGRAGQVRT